MSSGGGSLGLLAWLLLLQPWPWQNWAGRAAPLLPSALLSEEGRENPKASPASGPAAGPPPNLFTSFPVCGRTPLRIMGGVDAEEGKWPWQVRSDTRGWGAFWGQASPLKHPLSSIALAIWQQRNKTHSEAGGGLCIGRLAIGMSKLGRQTKFESDQGRVFGDGDGVVGVVAREIEASLRNIGNVWKRHKECFLGLFLEACPLSHSRLRYSVKMGDRSVYKENTSVVVPVRRAFVHPKFSTVIAVQNDLALLRLHHPVNFTSNIQPICIPQENFQVEARTRCWVTGWGKTQEGEKLTSEILQEVDQYIMRYEECNKIIKKALSSTTDVIKKGMVCGYKEQGKDSCQGDSGGPLACEYDDTWVQVGIVSWGIGCGRRGLPGIYTEIGVYSKWLMAVVAQATCSYPAVFLILLLHLLRPLGILVAL
nr:serine protease 42 isoform X2 [Macaca nemestrina]